LVKAFKRYKQKYALAPFLDHPDIHSVAVIYILCLIFFFLFLSLQRSKFLESRSIMLHGTRVVPVWFDLEPPPQLIFPLK